MAEDDGQAIPQNDNYSGWGWKQIQLAILGSVSADRETEAALVSGVSEPESLRRAARSFQAVQTNLNEVKLRLEYRSDVLMGSEGTWRGDAATAFQGLAFEIRSALQSRLDTVGGSPSYSDSLEDSANALQQAISDIIRINREGAAKAKAAYDAKMQAWKDANQPVNVDPGPGPSPVFEKNGTEIVAVSKFPEVVAWLDEQMSGVITKLSTTYKSKQSAIRPLSTVKYPTPSDPAKPDPNGNLPGGAPKKDPGSGDKPSDSGGDFSFDDAMPVLKPTSSQPLSQSVPGGVGNPDFQVLGAPSAGALGVGGLPLLTGSHAGLSAVQSPLGGPAGLEGDLGLGQLGDGALGVLGFAGLGAAAARFNPTPAAGLPGRPRPNSSRVLGADALRTLANDAVGHRLARPMVAGDPPPGALPGATRYGHGPTAAAQSEQGMRYPMGGMGAGGLGGAGIGPLGGQQDRDRESRLIEDRDPWGTDEESTGVLGRTDEAKTE
ncbi:WXG100 family type VII secretion target [Streptomyces sp. NPDC054841]